MHFILEIHFPYWEPLLFIKDVLAVFEINNKTINSIRGRPIYVTHLWGEGHLRFVTKCDRGARVS